MLLLLLKEPILEQSFFFFRTASVNVDVQLDLLLSLESGTYV